MTEEKSRLSELKFGALPETSRAGFCLLENMQIKYVNSRFCDLTGYNREELHDLDPLELVHPADVAELVERRDDWLLSDGKSFELETRIITKKKKVIWLRIFGSRTTVGNTSTLNLVAVDNSDHHSTDEFLEQSLNSYESFIDSYSDAIHIQDSKGRFVRVNDRLADMLGYDKKYLIGKFPADFTATEKVNMNQLREYFDQALEGSNQRFKCWGRKKSGEIFPTEVHLTPGTYHGEKVVFVVTRDISRSYQKRQKHQENIKDLEKNVEQLQSSLRQKETHMAEIHHRVKNNLAVITGLLELQSYAIENEEANKALLNSRSRIHSMALIHQKLYQSEDFSKIQFDVYIQELLEIITNTYMTAEQSVNVRVEADPVRLGISQGIPCSLLLNEIVTNSLKHAFPEGESGKILVTFRRMEDDRLLFSVADNGSGLPAGFNEIKSESLGMKLINTLSKQLNADMTVDTSEGTRFEFTFPHEEIDDEEDEHKGG